MLPSDLSAKASIWPPTSPSGSYAIVKSTKWIAKGRASPIVRGGWVSHVSESARARGLVRFKNSWKTAVFPAAHHAPSGHSTDVLVMMEWLAASKITRLIATVILPFSTLAKMPTVRLPSSIAASLDTSSGSRCCMSRQLPAMAWLQLFATALTLAPLPLIGMSRAAFAASSVLLQLGSPTSFLRLVVPALANITRPPSAAILQYVLLGGGGWLVPVCI